MKTHYAFLLTAICLASWSCESQQQSGVSVHVESPSPTLTPLTTANTQPPSPALPVNSTGIQEAKYGTYSYTYKLEGNTAAAAFMPRFLPRDDKIVVGAIRDVIRHAFKEETYGAPYLVDTTTGSGVAVRAVRVDGVKNGFVIVPVKEDTGEVHSLTITRVAKN
jgi:hypothetical protein